MMVQCVRVLARAMLAIAGLGIFTAFSSAYAQQALFSEVRTIASDAAALEKGFDIPANGEYNLTLTDFAFPGALDAIRVAVTRGDTVVTTLNQAEANHRFTATAGPHVLRVVGIPNAALRSGQFGVEIKAVTGGASVLQYSEAVALSPEDAQGRGVIAATFTSPAAGNYEVTLSDLQLPQTLQILTLTLKRTGSDDLFTMNAAGTQTFALQAGVYQIFVAGQAVSGANAGLFSAEVRPAGGGASLFSQTMPIGDVVTLGTVDASAGTHSLVLSDFAFPVALTQSGLVIARNGVSAARLSAPGTISFPATAGTYSLYGYAVAAAAPASGSYGVELRGPGGTAIFSAAKTVGGAPGATPSFAYPIDITAAGTYRVRLTDFELPAPLMPLSLAATQGGALLGSLSNSGSLDLDLAAGRLFLLVIAKPATGQGALFGLALTPAAGGDAVFETTQGVGGLFSSRKVTVTTAGVYTIGVTDLAFPKRFVDLSAIVTRGTERSGSIFGGGSFNFNATPGDYFINFIAQGTLVDETKSTTQRAGTYSMSAAAASPAPSITTFTANPAQVRSGESVNLTWSTQNATACTASGGWSGSKSMQGTEPSGPLTASTSFKLTCNGPGGTTDQSVSVGILTSSGGGGGALEWLTLLFLAAMIRVSLMRAR